MSRGDRREEIFRDDSDRKRFLNVLGKACAKNGWQVHAYCLMSNHFHAVMETPEPNLAAGMRWLLGTEKSDSEQDKSDSTRPAPEPMPVTGLVFQV